MLARGLTSLGCAIGLWSALLDAPSAYACSRAAIEPFRIDRTLTPDDTQAPETFRQLSAYTYRIEAERCSGASCSASSCGDAGYLLLKFAPPAEAEAEAEEGALGYRLVWLRGGAPPSLLRQLERIMPLDPQTDAITVELSFRDVTQLDGELALIAIDRAGNESEPSEPVHVSWSGCTEYFDDPFCARSEVVVPPEVDQRCTLSAGPRAGSGLPLTAAIALGLGLAARARTRRSRSGSVR